MSREYAEISWRIEDIQELRPNWTEAKCAEFLEQNEEDLIETMMSSGYDAITYILASEDDV